MTRSELNRAVARATGESIATVQSMGFQIIPDEDEPVDMEPQYVWLDCPFCRSALLLSTLGGDELPEYAECHNCDTLFDFHEEELYEAELDEIEPHTPKSGCRYIAA